MREPAWQHALDSQLSAIHSLTDLIQTAWPKSMRAELVPTWQTDLTLLKHATPYAWSTNTINAVMAAAKSIPLDTKINVWNIESTAAWWKFDVELPLQTLSAPVGVIAFSFGWIVDRDIRDFDEHGNIVRNDERSVQVTAWCPGVEGIKHPYMASQVFRWEDGQTLGEMLEYNRDKHRRLYGPGGPWADREQIGEDAFMHATETIARFILAGLAWINQHVLITETPQLERHRRKQLLRATDQKVSTVKVVQLRRAEYTGPKAPGDGSREYSVRFIVDGHWRNQPCGTGLTERRLIYIMPYMKGPEGAPLKVPDITVYRVSR